jgi:hypothetical protein
MLVDRYEIYADEAWTHGGQPPNRYWCIYGGIFGKEADMSRLDTALRSAAASIRGEVKWSNLTPSNRLAYERFVGCMFDAADRGEIKFRQMFCDRAHVRVAPYGEANVSELDVQFKLCYQFIKHAFGIAHLDPDRKAEVLVRLDTHSSQKHKKDLAVHAMGIPAVLRREKLSLRITYERSDQQPRIQVADLVIGAAGSHGNKRHKIRENGRRGMTAKQEAREKFSKYVYDRLRAINARERGARAFNWFESTGKDNDRANLLKHTVRIWKFVPKQYRIDKGWQNDHLDPQGRYQGPDIGAKVFDVDPSEPYWNAGGRHPETTP